MKKEEFERWIEAVSPRFMEVTASRNISSETVRDKIDKVPADII